MVAEVLNKKIIEMLKNVINKHGFNVLDISENEPGKKIEFIQPCVMLNRIITDDENGYYEYDLISHSNENEIVLNELDCAFENIEDGSDYYSFKLNKSFGKGTVLHYMFSYSNDNMDDCEIDDAIDTSENNSNETVDDNAMGNPNFDIYFDAYYNPHNDENITKELLDFRRIIGDIFEPYAFKRFSLKGSGDKVLKDIKFNCAPAFIMLGKVENSTSNCFVKLIDETGNYDSLVNEIGNMKKFFFITPDNVCQSYYLQIESDGDWEFTFISMQEHIQFMGRKEEYGKGSFVSQCIIGDGKMKMFSFNHKGNSNVFVKLYDCDMSYDSLVNEIGNITTEKMIKLELNHIYYFVVLCDGFWKYKIE